MFGIGSRCMDKHDRFKRLYKKFVDGLLWLNKGVPTERDKEEFNRLVVEPMDALWATFTDEEKEYWNKVRYAVDLFNGTIVDEDEERIKQQREERKKRKKRWRSYSQPS